MAKKFMIMAIVLFAGLSWQPAWADSPAQMMVTVQPDTIQIGVGYNGQNITVAGKIPSDASVLIRVTGETEQYNLKQKGRAFGLLWMNLGSVEVSGVPGVFMLFPPEATSETQPAAWRDLDLGLKGLREGAQIVSGDSDKDALFDEFIKLKNKSGLYATVEGAIRMGPDDGVLKSFNAQLPMPSALPQGVFNVEVYAIRNGAVAGTDVHKIVAKEVGMPAWISALAFQHGTLYGVLSVLIAVMAGLLTGMLFKGEKGAH